MILFGLLVLFGVTFILLAHIHPISEGEILSHFMRDIGIAFLVAAIIDSSSARETRKKIDQLIRFKTESLLQKLSEDNSLLLKKLSEGFDEMFSKILMLFSEDVDVSRNTQAAIRKTLELPLIRDKYLVDLNIIKCDQESTVISYLVDTEVVNLSRERTIEHLLKIGVQKHHPTMAKSTLAALEINGKPIAIDSLNLREQMFDYNEYEAMYMLSPGDRLCYKFMVEEEHFFERFDIRFTTLIITQGFVAKIRGHHQNVLHIKPVLMGHGHIIRSEDTNHVIEFRYDGGCLLPHQGIAINFTKITAEEGMWPDQMQRTAKSQSVLL